MRIITWNVNGIRAAFKKGLWSKLDEIKADVIAIQETKTDGEKMIKEVLPVLENNNHSYLYHSATSRKGYSGVATLFNNDTFDIVEQPTDDLFDQVSQSKVSSKFKVFSHKIGVDNPKFDEEGRTVITEIQGAQDSIVLFNNYYPQGGRGQHRIDYKIEFYKELEKLIKDYQKQEKQVILTGDFNTTFGDLDLARPKENKKNTGCLPEEREALSWFVDLGLEDLWRENNPDSQTYTFWDQKSRARDRDVGWRIDMFLVDSKLKNKVKKTEILSDVMGSDHCPVLLDIDI